MIKQIVFKTESGKNIVLLTDEEEIICSDLADCLTTTLETYFLSSIKVDQEYL